MIETSSLTQTDLSGKSLLYPAYGPSTTGSYIEDGQRLIALPSHGVSGKNCGTVRFGYCCSNDRCEDHGKVHLYHENCGSMLCPSCHTKAEERAARRITDRLDGMKGAYEAEGRHFGPLDHVELSPPPDRFSEAEIGTLEGYRRAFQWAEDLLRQHVRNPAGVLVIHPWRFKHPDGSTCDEKKHCDQHHIPVYGLHFHFVGYGYWQKSSEVHELTGAVYKKIRPGESRDIFATVAYELSHCGLMMEARRGAYDHGRKVGGTDDILEYVQLSTPYRYVGLFSNSKGGFKKEGQTKVVQLCEKCQSEVHKYDLDEKDGQLILFRDIGPMMETVIKGHWYINHRSGQAALPRSPRARGPP